MNLILWNKKENRPATPTEIDRLINTNYDQLFSSWHKYPTEEQKGVIMFHIDSAEEENFKLINPANEFILEIAKLVGIDTDGIGYDGLQLTIDDFKEALAEKEKDKYTGLHKSSPRNSTDFTNCCHCAVTSKQNKCPKCGALIYGRQS